MAVLALNCALLVSLGLLVVGGSILFLASAVSACAQELHRLADSAKGATRGSWEEFGGVGGSR